MSKFFFILWLRWTFFVTLSSVLSASILSFCVTLYLYVSQDSQVLNAEIYVALFKIFKFWFVVFWSVTLLASLFGVLKYIFNSCHNAYKLTLLTCPKEGKSEAIEEIGYGDLVKVWRKWLMLIIWLVGAEMIIVLIFTKLFSSYSSVFDWFNIYVLYIFILLSGYFSFMILSSRCKIVKLVKC